ncbi:hypothetical protein [Rhizorhabdus argentea]
MSNATSTTSWCVDLIGDAAPIDNFDPTMFAAVTDEEAALLSID